MFNKVVLVGNMTRDIELRYASGGAAISKTAIATSRKFTANGEKKEETCFIDIVAFGRTAEVMNQYLRSGSKILIEGHLKFEQWVAQDGSKRSKHVVQIESMQMLDTLPKHDSTNSYQAPKPQYEEIPLTPKSEQNYQEMLNSAPQQQQMNMNQADEDEIPF